jgi:hypothetical protein
MVMIVWILKFVEMVVSVKIVMSAMNVRAFENYADRCRVWLNQDRMSSSINDILYQGFAGWLNVTVLAIQTISTITTIQIYPMKYTQYQRSEFHRGHLNYLNHK